MEFTAKNLRINISNGIITDIQPGDSDSNLYISPRFIDLHCHLREPGGENKETLKSGIESAFYGGYGTIFTMPNTNPVCDNPDTLNYILSNSKNQYSTIVKPICAITSGLSSENITDFAELKKLGACGFSNDGKPIENMEVLKKVLIKAKQSDVFLVSHAENTSYPPQDSHSEWTAVKREIDIVRETGGKLHFAHISTKESIELIRQAKQEGLHITAETAPHYFTFSREDITSDDGRFKMNPPLRSPEDVAAVKAGLKDGTIDIIATDHAPHTRDEKLLPYDKAPSGITGLETAFSLAYTNLERTKVLTMEELINKFVYNPAKIAGAKFHSIEKGGIAEFNIIDLNKRYTVLGTKFKTKCKITPYEGIELAGKVISVVVGNKVYNLENGETEWV